MDNKEDGGIDMSLKIILDNEYLIKKKTGKTVIAIRKRNGYYRFYEGSSFEDYKEIRNTDWDIFVNEIKEYISNNSGKEDKLQLEEFLNMIK